jgi:sugar O-acyltransferase (sialic acid O-acetyltransferase NeuD family)
VVFDLALDLGYRLNGYFNPTPISENPFNLAYLGDEIKVDVAQHVGGGFVFPAMGSNSIRESLLKMPSLKDLKFPVLVARNAYVSSKAQLGRGTLIATRSVVHPMAFVGEGSIVNTGAIVEHECSVGHYTHIAPGAILAGSVVLGDRVFIGANATVKEGVVIGRDSVIGAGAVILKDVGPNEVWVGNPGRRIR